MCMVSNVADRMSPTLIVLTEMSRKEVWLGCVSLESLGLTRMLVAMV